MIFSKTPLNISLAFLLGMVLTACDKAPTTAGKPVSAESTVNATTATTPNTATITVAMDATYPPYDFKGEKGEAMGFDIDILNAIGEKQGFKPNFLPKPWDSMEEGLVSGQYNLIMSAVTRSPEREQKFEASDTYTYGQDTMLMKPELTTINKFEDLKNVKVATQGGTGSADDLIKLQGKGNPNTLLEKTNFLAFQDVILGKADVALADAGVLRYHAKAVPNEKFRFANEGDYFKTYEMIALAKKGDRANIDKFNAGLKQIVADGTYAKIYEKWFGVAPTPEQLPHGVLTASATPATSATK